MHRLNFRSDAIIHPQVASVRSNASASESANSFATAGTTAGHAAGVASSQQPRPVSDDVRVSIDELPEPEPEADAILPPAVPDRRGCWEVVRTALARAPMIPRTKVVLLTPVAYAQIVAGIVILGLSTHEVSKQPLRVFVILHIVRLFLYYPLYVTHQLWAHRIAACSRNFRMWHTGAGTFLAPVAAGALFRHRHGAAAAPGRGRLCVSLMCAIGNRALGKIPTRTLRHLLDVCSVVLFIAGNHWVFSGKTDNATAPLLHYLSLTYIILGYLYVSLPLLLLFFLFVIFSVFYVFSPDFRMRMHEKKGAKLGQILQIPLVRFADTRLAARTTPHSSPPSLHGDRRSDGVGPGPAEADIAAMPAASQSAASLHEQAARRRPGLSHIHFFNPFARAVRRLTRSRRQRETEAEMYKNQLAGPVPDFMPRDADDCTCAICLDDYKDGAILRLLPCGHHMHQACVDEWLHINQTCPLCKQSAVSGELQAQETSPAAHEASAPGCVDAAATAGEPALAAPAPVH
ncbi:hypothetical protein IWW51_003575 [Coemansia sp. RSA 2702]|nr:hypothetical protein IWW51_003575 [Coemansia sp. RSA 2702]